MKKPSKSAPPEAGPRKTAPDSFCYRDGDVLVLNVLGTPSAKMDAIGKVKGTQLKISVSAAPDDGKATDHMVKFLAREFGIAAKNIEVVFGRFNINKQLRITAPQKLPAVISDELARQAGSAVTG